MKKKRGQSGHCSVFDSYWLDWNFLKQQVNIGKLKKFKIRTGRLLILEGLNRNSPIKQFLF